MTASLYQSDLAAVDRPVAALLLPLSLIVALPGGNSRQIA